MFFLADSGREFGGPYQNISPRSVMTDGPSEASMKMGFIVAARAAPLQPAAAR